MDDWDPTDRVVVIVHEPGLVGDDGPTVTTPPRDAEPPLLDDPTERHKCEFDEDTVVEDDNWAHAPN